MKRRFVASAAGAKAWSHSGRKRLPRNQNPKKQNASPSADTIMWSIGNKRNKLSVDVRKPMSRSGVRKHIIARRGGHCCDVWDSCGPRFVYTWTRMA